MNSGRTLFGISDWRSPAAMLMVMAATSFFVFAIWANLLNNFAVEEIGFTGREIGIVQSIREIPGFLAFTTVFVLFLLREQTFVVISLVIMGIGVGITGFFPSVSGFYMTTLIMSAGFHYHETVFQSLSLQWLKKDEAPRVLGRIVSVGAFAQLAAYGMIYVAWKMFSMSFQTAFVIAGVVTIAIAMFLWLAYPHFKEEVPQHKKLILRQRYWLFYALTFMSGARRQIFTVFAGFLMVEKFGFHVHEIAVLFIINCLISIYLAPKIGDFIARFGERRALTLEYIGLIGIFCTYAFVTNAYLACALYVVDHVFFAMAIAIKTYFQKIADPADIAPTAGVAFSINHIAAVVIPVVFGFVWLYSPMIVFLLGAAMAGISLILARMVPYDPEPGLEVVWKKRPPVGAPAE